jgi:hypothetical protein
VITLPLVGYYAWLFFGSIQAVVIGVVVYLVVFLSVQGFLRALAQG